MYAEWTLCRIHSYDTKNTLLEGKQFNGTLKRKDTSFLNNVTLSLCFSYPNVLYMPSSKVFLYHVTIFSKGPITDSMGTLIRQLLWIGILNRHVLEIYYCKNHSLKGQVFVNYKSNIIMAGCPENLIR